MHGVIQSSPSAWFWIRYESIDYGAGHKFGYGEVLYNGQICMRLFNGAVSRGFNIPDAKSRTVLDRAVDKYLGDLGGSD